ncbi:MAG TPA: PBP1A family penicillin-binding protein [Gaiellaceae bacterium]|nr:PBP1A family penicillin-binding protein [Gaiellaceae bacterium]
MRLRRSKETRPKRRRIRKLRLSALLLVLFTLASVAFGLGLVRAVAGEIPKLDPARQQSADDLDSVIYASNGRSVLAVLRGSESRVLVRSIDEISPLMRQAIVSVEDKRFYEHSGVDLRGIARALWEDVRSGGVVEGGSTITQQFVKNAYIRNEQSIGRKVREAALAWQLEQRWSKDRILTAYLNTIYFGNGAYGIQQAARTYFRKGASKLRLHEAALLAGIPANPTLYDPVVHPRAAKARRHFVLLQMLEQGKISPLDVRIASAKPLPRPDEIRLPGTQGPAPYFTNYVVDQLVERYGAGRVFGGGLHVTTTIDLRLQELARQAIEKILPGEDGPAAALVAIDPRTGAVRAMFGGSSFQRSQFNLATQAERQPGSSFKPIVLATALRQGISPVTTFPSRPVEIDAGDRVWKVTNYESAYLGTADLARAMVSSDNSVYAQLTQLVTPKKIVQTAESLGIRSRLDPYFSIGLGAVAVNPLDMARAYATIANDGRRVDGSVLGDRARVVDQVEWVKSGRVKANAPVGRQVLTEGESRLLTSILEDVVQRGTGVRAALPGREVAGKTGTTDDYGDAWFVGYTPQLVVAVWVGYPNELRPMLTEFDGEPVAGGTLPAEIWKEFAGRALRTLREQPESFPAPPYLPAYERRVVWRGGGYKLDNGLCAGTRVVAYFAGSGPSESAGCRPNEVNVPRVVGKTVDAARASLEATPLDVTVIYKPAAASSRPGLVVAQQPRGGGFLSAYETVRLTVTKARYGLVPNLVGSSVSEARDQLRRRKLHARISWGQGPPGTVVSQTPEAGVAADPALAISLVVAPSPAQAQAQVAAAGG